MDMKFSIGVPVLQRQLLAGSATALAFVERPVATFAAAHSLAGFTLALGGPPARPLFTANAAKSVVVRWSL
jgi:hypothetical protein